MKREGFVYVAFVTDVFSRRIVGWRSLEEVEFAMVEWVDWFNNGQVLEPIGDVPPAEFEAM